MFRNVSAGAVYQLVFKGGTSQLAVMISGDAGIVMNGKSLKARTQRFAYPPGNQHGCIFTRTTDDVVEIGCDSHYGYAIRDAATWELLFKSNFERLEPTTLTHRLGKYRLIAILPNQYNSTLTLHRGLLPYVATKSDDWFTP